MREILLLILGGILLIALAIGGRVYCGANLEPVVSPIACQQEVLQEFVSRPKNCICEEMRVSYGFKKDNYLIRHLAHYNPGQKTLCIETDPGSGWSFGWENVDTPLIERVLREGGDFRLSTKYCPTSTHPPGPEILPY